jgi:hypothetical protein
MHGTTGSKEAFKNFKLSLSVKFGLRACAIPADYIRAIATRMVECSLQRIWAYDSILRDII